MLTALVKPSALNLFRDRGIDVHSVYERAQVQYNGETREFDILLEDTTPLHVRHQSCPSLGQTPVAVNQFTSPLRLAP